MSDDVIRRGLLWELPSTARGLEWAKKAEAKTLTAVEIVRALEPLGVWWGMESQYGGLAEYESHAGANFGTPAVQMLAEMREETAEGLRGGTEQDNWFGGQIAVVLTAKRPQHVSGVPWDPAVHNQPGTLWSGNSYLPDGQPLEIVEVRYDATGDEDYVVLRTGGIRTTAMSDLRGTHFTTPEAAKAIRAGGFESLWEGLGWESDIRHAIREKSGTHQKALCGAPAEPQQREFDPDHPRACKRCLRLAKTAAPLSSLRMAADILGQEVVQQLLSDPDTKRLYSVEQQLKARLFNFPQMSISALQSLADRIGPKVGVMEIGQAGVAGTGNFNGKPAFIGVGPDMRDEVTLIHEMAHVQRGVKGAAAPGLPDHGPDFLKHYLRLLRKYCSNPDYAKMLSGNMGGRYASQHFAGPMDDYIPARFRGRPPTHDQLDDPRQVVFDRPALEDIEDLPNDIAPRLRAALEDLQVGRAELDDKERELAGVYTLKVTPKWRAAVYLGADGNWHCFWVGPHNYEEVTKRWTRTAKTALPSWRDRGVMPERAEAIIAPDQGRAHRNSYMVYLYGQPHARRTTLAEAKATVEGIYGDLDWVKVPGDPDPHPDRIWGDTTMFNDAPHYWVVERLPRLGVTATRLGLVGESYWGVAGDRSHITRNEKGYIPTSALRHMQGANGEKPGQHRNKQGQEWEDFCDDIEANSIREPIFITVDPGTGPVISEGNHRRDAALERDLGEVPVNIRYFGKAEDEHLVAPQIPRDIRPPAPAGWSGRIEASAEWPSRSDLPDGPVTLYRAEHRPPDADFSRPGSLGVHWSTKALDPGYQHEPGWKRVVWQAVAQPEDIEDATDRYGEKEVVLRSGARVTVTGRTERMDGPYVDVRAGDPEFPMGITVPIEGTRIAAKAATLDHWRPTTGMFAPGKDTLDPRVFDLDTQQVRPEVRFSVIKILDADWTPKYGDWRQWAKVYLAGSAASYWWDSDTDLDILIGVDLERLREVRPANREVSEADILGTLNRSLRDLTATDFLGQWTLTFFVNPDSYDIREVHPYAAYDLTGDEWVVKPPVLPANWGPDSIPEETWRRCEMAARNAEQALSLPEPERTLAGTIYFDWVKAGRQAAYSAHGGGWLDPGNVAYQYLSLHPERYLRRLYLCKHPEQVEGSEVVEKTASTQGLTLVTRGDPMSGRNMVWEARSYGGPLSGEHGSLAGYLRFDSSRDRVRILSLEVNPGYQRQGVATWLLQQFLRSWDIEEVDPGEFTPAGAALWKKVTGQDVRPSTSMNLSNTRDWRLAAGSSSTHTVTTGDYEGIAFEYERKYRGRNGQEYFLIREPTSYVARTPDGRQAGYLTVVVSTNEIGVVSVVPEHQRQGIATALLEMAREDYPGLAHTSVPGQLSPSGAGWAQHVGARTIDMTPPMPDGWQGNGIYEMDISRFSSTGCVALLGDVAGMIWPFGWLTWDRDRYTIEGIWVNPDYRGKGIGIEMMKAAEKVAGRSLKNDSGEYTSEGFEWAKKRGIDPTMQSQVSASDMARMQARMNDVLIGGHLLKRQVQKVGARTSAWGDHFRGGTIYRGLRANLPPDVDAKVRELLAMETDEESYARWKPYGGKKVQAGELIVRALEKSHWDPEMGLGRHWSERWDMADIGARQGGRGDWGVILTATYTLDDVDWSWFNAGSVTTRESEAEVTLKPGARIEVTKVELRTDFGYETVSYKPIRATASTSPPLLSQATRRGEIQITV